MTDYPSSTPVRFAPSMEQIAEDEAETEAGLIETLDSISATTFRDSGLALRGVHAKSHGLLRGTLHVLDDLPPTLAQGLFAQLGQYPVAMRFSAVPGDVLDDKVSTPRGLAIKIIGVEGERLPGSEADVTQDFVMINGPAFVVSSAKKFLGSLKLLAATTDKAEGAKKLVSAMARGTEAVLEAFGGKSAAITFMGGQKETHVLDETYYTGGPVLYGPYIAKLSMAPSSPELIALAGTAVDLKDRPNGLRDAVAAHFATKGGEWELRVQLCTDLGAMPIEDASVAWPEDQSPYIAVARVTVAPQDAWSPANVAAIDQGMAFSPWHGLAAHRPLGSVMRVRRAAYASSAQSRAARGVCPIHEPRPAEVAS